MVRAVVVAAGLTLGAAVPAAAQDQAMAPGPAQARLAYFVGTWTFEGEAKDGPLGAGGPIRSESECEWFEGGFHVVCESRGTNPRGEASGLAVMSYDPSRQEYTYYAVTSMGENFHVYGTVDGKVWTWANEVDVGGKPFRYRVSLTEESPTAYAFVMEGSYDGSPWAVMEEGRATKQ